MKKILFISKYLSTRQNGFETRLACLIKYFKKYNYDVLAITSSFSLKKEKFKNQFTKKKLDGVNYIFIKENNNYSLYSFQRVFSWINFEINLFKLNFNKLGFVPDVIYVSSLSLLTIINGIILKKKFNTKLVFEMRDLWPYFLYTTGKFSRFNPFVVFLSLVEKCGIFYSDLIVGLIPRINEYIRDRGFFKKTLASTFPVNIEFFKIKKKKLLIKNKEKFNICYAGNFGFDNYLNDLLNLISKINSNNFFFHFIGDGSQKKNLQKKFSNLKNVKFYNPVNYTDLHSVLVEMDSLILSFGFNKNNYKIYGYELNKINNYLMAKKPIIVLGNKKNLSNSRGRFVYISRNCEIFFYKKLLYVKKNYNSLKRIANFNKQKLLIRNNPDTIFKKIQQNIKNL